MIHVPIIHFKRYKKIGNIVSEVQLYLKVQKQDCNICTKTAISAKKKKGNYFGCPLFLEEGCFSACVALML